MNNFQSRPYLTEGFEYTCPLLLSPERQSNPYLELESFFYGASLGYYQRELRSWFEISLTERMEVDDHEGLNFFHNQLIQLFQAGYLIVKKNLKYAPEVDSVNKFKKRINSLRQQKFCGGNGKAANYEIHLLSENEIANPFFYLKQILNLPRIAEMRYGLQEWTFCSFDGQSSIATMDAQYVFNLFDDIGKVMEMLFILIAGEEN